MIRVVHVTSVHVPLDTRIFEKMCKSIQQAGHSIVLVAPYIEDTIIDGIPVRGIKQYRSRIKRLLFGTRQAVRRALEENGDIYHFHDPELIPWAWYLRKRGKIVIFDMHENLPTTIGIKSWIPRLLRSPLLFVWSRLERLFLKSTPVIFAEHSYHKHYSWVRTHKTVLNFPKFEKLQNLAISRDEPLAIVYIGGINHNRGSFIMLEILKELKSRSIALELHCIGPTTPKHMHELTARINEFGLDNVHFHGRLPAPEAWKIAAQCHIGLALLQPIPNYTESYPTKMFEYMAMGLPVIVSDFALYRDIVETHQCGINVDPTNIKDAADAIEWLLTHMKEAKVMGEAGRQATRQNFSWVNEERKMLEFYRYLLSDEIP